MPADVIQIIDAIEEMKANIEQLKKDIADAKSRHTEASKDVKRIEKDISDFSNNKDSKLAELQSSLESLKKTQMKSSVSTKTLQKDLQEARLEFEQIGADLGASKDQVAEVDNTLEAQEEEIRELQIEQDKTQVCVLRLITSNTQILETTPLLLQILFLEFGNITS